MGAYLSAPKTDKESHTGENNSFKYGVTAMQGWRTEMEDAHATILDVVDGNGNGTGMGFFGVFDGHGGKEVAKYAAKYMATVLIATHSWQTGNLETALTEAYLKLDEIISKEASRDELLNMAGSTDEPIKKYEIPDYMRTALLARLKQEGAIGEDEEWSGDEFEDPMYDPLVEMEEGVKEEKDGVNVMSKDDSDEDDSEGTTHGSAHESGQEEVIEGSDESDKESSPSASKEDELLEQDTWERPSATHEYRGPTAGCTAVVAIIKDSVLYVANAGDSRCVASRNGQAIAMTTDHKPTDDGERSRILSAGGFVADGRVNGSLNLSRALGDLEYKRTPDLPPAQQMITANPEIRTLKLAPGDEFLILACDGIWDVLTNQQAVDFVWERLRGGMEPLAICEAMCDSCLAPDTDGCGEGCDNMSAMIVVLKQFASAAINEGATPIAPNPGLA